MDLWRFFLLQRNIQRRGIISPSRGNPGEGFLILNLGLVAVFLISKKYSTQENYFTKPGESWGGFFDFKPWTCGGFFNFKEIFNAGELFHQAGGILGRVF